MPQGIGDGGTVEIQSTAWEMRAILPAMHPARECGDPHLLFSAVQDAKGDVGSYRWSFQGEEKEAGNAHALDICPLPVLCARHGEEDAGVADRKSTRLNSSHANISYAV